MVSSSVGLRTEDEAAARKVTARPAFERAFLNRLRTTGLPIRELCRYVELVNAGPDTEPARLGMLLDRRAMVLAQLEELNAAL
jgi:DNA-binding transcriptional MerR regulator